MVVSEAMLPTETIKSTVTASGQNKESFFSHNSATFSLSESQKTRTADKESSTGQWRWRENKLRKSRFSLPDKHAAYLSQKIKVLKPTHRGLGHLYQLFWFSLKSSTYAQVDASCYLRLKEKGRRGI